MAFITSMLKKLLSDSEQYSSDNRDHYLQLERLRIDHDWISAKITKSGEIYQSLILQVDIENSELIIEELYPPTNLEKIAPGDTVNIYSQNDNKPVNLYSRVLAREHHDGEACWRLQLPSETGGNHSRNAFRIYAEHEQNLQIELCSNNQPLQDVRIIDISAEGIKLSFSAALKGQLHQHQVFPASIIHLPNAIDIECDIRLCNLYSTKSPLPRLFGGGRLTIANPRQRIKLQQYLASVQRQQRRQQVSNEVLRKLLDQ